MRSLLQCNHGSMKSLDMSKDPSEDAFLCVCVRVLVCARTGFDLFQRLLLVHKHTEEEAKSECVKRKTAFILAFFTACVCFGDSNRDWKVKPV